MLISVIPLDSSIDARSLTYYVQEELRRQFVVGSIVEVPIRNNLSFAVVTALKAGSDTPEEVRSISRVVCSVPIVAPYAVETILSLAAHSFIHAHKVLTLFLPKWLIRYVEKKSFIELEYSKSLLPKKPSPIELLHLTDASRLTETIDQILQTNEKTVVIFPDDFAIDGYLERTKIRISTKPRTSEKWWNSRENWRNAPSGGSPEWAVLSGTANEEAEVWTWSSHFAEVPITLLQNGMTDTKRYRAFIDTFSEKNSIIIWTRRLLYYNLSHYPNIVYIEDALGRTTMQYNHFYRNIDVLERITESGHFHTTILSTLPTIASMYRVHEGKYKRVQN